MRKMGRYIIGAALTGAVVGLLAVVADWSDNTIFWAFLAATVVYCTLGSLHESHTGRKSRAP